MSNTKLPSGAAYTTIDNFDEMKFLLNDILGGACKEIECDKVLHIDILDHLATKGCHQITGVEAGCGQEIVPKLTPRRLIVKFDNFGSSIA